MPPVGHPLDTGSQAAFTIATAVVAVVALAVFAGTARRRSSVWPLAVLASGVLCLLLEPVYDNSFHVWFYGGQGGAGLWKAYTAYGMAQPLWVPITYVWCYGGLALWAATRVDRGLTRRGAAKLALVFAGIYLTFELVGINLDVYTYFGRHPFRVLGFPVWVTVSNATIGVIAGILVARLRPMLPGPRVWALVPVIPAVFAMISFGGSFPALVALNMPNPPTALVWLAAIVSMALSGALLSLACLLLPSSLGAPAGVGSGTPDSAGLMAAPWNLDRAEIDGDPRPSLSV